jgi:hypothetical protein
MMIQGAKMLEIIQNQKISALKGSICSYLMVSAKRACRATVIDHEDVDSNRILVDVDVQSITDSSRTREEKTRDIDEFFGKPFKHAGANGTVKKHRKCKACP